jgi:kinesin family member 6/9
MSSSDSTIQIYCRVRPIKKNKKLVYDKGQYWISPDEDGSRIGFHIPKDQLQGLVNHSKENFEFKFDHLFDMDSNQEEIFDVVAKPVVQSAMGGYNGTIFAYGQTGSGKTFTITGGAEKYSDRGLIPRTLQHIFKEIEKDTQTRYTVHVSYLEIYNEVGYDLLDSSRDAKRLEDLPKVTIQEDGNEYIHLRNLSVVQANSEEDALNLLFLGDTNRMIAETPSNPASSRSHCIFIISLTSHKNGSDVIRKSKLHLVDLAGSERVSRTGLDGNLLKEAKHINLSLHYLEQVIIALHEAGKGRRAHIPYRNSMMTSVLRDSLGGNCKTTMIATVAVEELLIDESISTCRFAQRVALISNHATLNEEMDPQLLIQRLKQEIARLKAELEIARGDGDTFPEELPVYEKER